MFIHFVIERTRGLDINALMKDLAGVSIPRQPKLQKQKTRKLALHLFILDKPGTFNQLTEELEGLVYITSFHIDLVGTEEYRWIDLEVDIPEKLDKFPRLAPIQVLERQLRNATFI